MMAIQCYRAACGVGNGRCSRGPCQSAQQLTSAKGLVLRFDLLRPVRRSLFTGLTRSLTVSLGFYAESAAALSLGYLRSGLCRNRETGLRLARHAETSFTSYLSALNSFKRERATFFTDSTANGRIL